MNRKQFLKQSAVVATGLLTAPALARAAKEETILGHNNKRYRINTHWSKVSADQYPVKDCLTVVNHFHLYKNISFY